MATGENCYGLEAGISRLDNVGSERNAAFDASKAAKGEETFNNILQPIRNAREAEKTATGTEKARLMDEIHAHYAEGKSPGSKTTKATQDISKAIQSDSDVQQYIRNMSPSEFGKARTEIKNTFGGDQARMMEHQYVNKMDDYEAALESSGKMIPSIKERIATTQRNKQAQQRYAAEQEASRAAAASAAEQARLKKIRDDEEFDRIRNLSQSGGA